MLIRADARFLPLRDGCVQCVVTSPPYWGLRDYGLATWSGGDPLCDHQVPVTGSTQNKGNNGRLGTPFRDQCGKCDAVRRDAGIGLESTPDAYVAQLVAVFRDVHRVLRDDGTVWINLGDTYAGGGNGGGGSFAKDGIRCALPGTDKNKATRYGKRGAVDGIKAKDLLGMPWSVAKALQAPYYAGRMPHERDRAWLAGIIDGEGTICGFHHIRADDGSPRTGVHVFITNGNLSMLAECERIWSASRSEHSHAGEGHLGGDTWRWICHGIENKLLFRREMYPYLHVKRAQALVGYNLLLLMRDAKRLGHTSQMQAVREKRRVLTEWLSDLNHQRPIDLPDWLIAPPSVTEPGWYLRSEIIWAKPAPMPESVTDRPTRAHEQIFLLTKRATYYYDAAAIAEPASANTHARGNGLNPKCRPFGEGIKQNESFSAAINGWVPKRNKRSVWTINPEPYEGGHFATFPEALVEPCILAGCPLNALVLDPFCGTGTVISVAQRLGRHGVGIDLAYHDLARARTAQQGLRFVEERSAETMQLQGDLFTPAG